MNSIIDRDNQRLLHRSKDHPHWRKTTPLAQRLPPLAQDDLFWSKDYLQWSKDHLQWSKATSNGTKTTSNGAKTTSNGATATPEGTQDSWIDGSVRSYSPQDSPKYLWHPTTQIKYLVFHLAAPPTKDPMRPITNGSAFLTLEIYLSQKKQERIDIEGGRAAAAQILERIPCYPRMNGCLCSAMLPVWVAENFALYGMGVA
ncbi:hypothetical protein JTB14_019076 [Gonioctena quinquepunctata]|nr:hypothetical protein JTB14_019076 [Gonioctena quinquepunctata]